MSIKTHHKLDDALAIHFGVAPCVIKQIRLGENWKHRPSLKPDRLPTIEDIPADAVPPKANLNKKVSDEDIPTLLIGYRESNDKMHYVRDVALRYKCSGNYIRDILTGKTRSHVAPEVERIDFALETQNTYPAAVIQAIRATWDHYKGQYYKKGLLSSLARQFGFSKGFVRRVCDRVTCLDVIDDPTAVIPREQLPFLPLTQRGEAHKRSNVTDAERFEIIRQLDAREKSTVRIAQDFLHRVSYTKLCQVANGKAWPEVWQKLLAWKAANNVFIKPDDPPVNQAREEDNE